MKKPLSFFTIMMLAAAVTLTSCRQEQQQTDTEIEVPLKVTYSIDCSRDLLALCDLVVTYKGNDGANVTDTITSSPGDTTEVQTWTKVVATHKVPVKIGFDYNLEPKTDSLVINRSTASLHAIGTIIAEKMGIRKRNPTPMPSEKIINGKHIFFKYYRMMDKKVNNTRSDLATCVKHHNDSLATSRATAESNTCFIIKSAPHGKTLRVKQARWNDNE